MSTCKNCGALAPGKFCQDCGQPVAPPPLDVAHFFRETVQGYFAMDGKTLSTLRALLTKPGFLTREYWEGRRARYTEPRRLYVFTSVLYFICLAYSPDTPIHVKITEDAGSQPASAQSGWFNERMLHAKSLGQPELERRVRVGFQSQMPKAMFALMPVYALLLLVVFRRRRYLEHITFTFHVHAVAFLALIPALFVKGLNSFAWIVIGTYAYLGMRRAYELPWRAAFWRYLVVSVAYLALLAAMMLALFFLAIVA